MVNGLNWWKFLMKGRFLGLGGCFDGGFWFLLLFVCFLMSISSIGNKRRDGDVRMKSGCSNMVVNVFG